MFKIDFNCQSSIFIQKPVAEVYSLISDFSSWPTWSPWLCMEEECDFSVNGQKATVGHGQKWVGKIIGSGEMTVTELDAPKSIDYELLFLKPWKSQSKVRFELEEQTSGTKVTWYMFGNLPFFMFFMKKSMKAYIESDYQRGLKMLKDLSESGTVHSASRAEGLKNEDSFLVVGIRNHCQLSEIGPTMQKDFDRLHKFVESGKLKAGEAAISLYPKFDPVSGECEYVCGYKYHEKPDMVPEGAEQLSVDSHKALCVRHDGDYKHLGNAWSKAFYHQRSEKLRLRKDVTMYELYLSDPRVVEVSKNITEIMLPIR